MEGTGKEVEEFEKIVSEGGHGLKEHGICVGCIVQCHDGHEVFELGQRLDFRCDCGNGRMPQACLLNAEKEDHENLKNSYN